MITGMAQKWISRISNEESWVQQCYIDCLYSDRACYKSEMVLHPTHMTSPQSPSFMRAAPSSTRWYPSHLQILSTRSKRSWRKKPWNAWQREKRIFELLTRINSHTHVVKWPQNGCMESKTQIHRRLYPSSMRISTCFGSFQIVLAEQGSSVWLLCY